MTDTEALRNLARAVDQIHKDLLLPIPSALALASAMRDAKEALNWAAGSEWGAG